MKPLFRVLDCEQPNEAGLSRSHCLSSPIVTPCGDDYRCEMMYAYAFYKHVVSFAGDNPLTACFVAKELNIVESDPLILTKVNNEWIWQSADESVQMPFDASRKAIKAVADDWNLCLTGAAIEHVRVTHPKELAQLIAFVDVSRCQFRHSVTQ